MKLMERCFPFIKKGNVKEWKNQLPDPRLSFFIKSLFFMVI